MKLLFIKNLQKQLIVLGTAMPPSVQLPELMLHVKSGLHQVAYLRRLISRYIDVLAKTFLRDSGRKMPAVHNGAATSDKRTWRASSIFIRSENKPTLYTIRSAQRQKENGPES